MFPGLNQFALGRSSLLLIELAIDAIDEEINPILEIGGGVGFAGIRFFGRVNDFLALTRQWRKNAFLG